MKLVLQPALGLAATPTSVIIGSASGTRRENVGLGGVVQISPPLRTDKLSLRFSSADGSAAGNQAAGQPAQLPVGLAGIRIPGLAGLHLAVLNPAASFRLGCGRGPLVTVDGRGYQTSVTGVIGSLLDLRPVQLHLCTPGGTLLLPAGRQELTTASKAFAVTSLSLASHPGTDLTGQARAVDVLTWQADARKVSVGPGPESYLEIHENVNAGWTATMNGHPLQAATLDGWQQAFVVPAGQGGVVVLTYAPATTYHAGIVASVVALLVLAGLALGIGRRRRGRPQPDEDAAQAVPSAAASGASYAGPADLGITHRGGPALVFQAYPEPHLRRHPPAELIPAGLASLRAHGRHRAARPGSRAPIMRRPTLAEAVRGLLILAPLAAVIFVAGGPVVLAVPALAIVDRWRPRWLPWIAAAAMLAAGLVAAAASTPTVPGSGPFSGAAQVFALIALAAALLPLIPARPRTPAPASERDQS
jgi:arabinofuranan 3-O-arabinosyltransferase